MAVAQDEALVLGAFQRRAGTDERWQVQRRASGGPEVRVGAGTVHVALCLATPAALFPCDEKRIVNRCVRPLLKALGRTGSLAHFFGRDWVSVAHRPAAWVGFAHDASTRRTAFEAFVAVSTPFAITERTSFLGKPQGTLDAIAGRRFDALRIADAIADAYAGAFGDHVQVEDLEPAEVPPHADEPIVARPWAATVEEAIGTLGAGPDDDGVFRFGGDLLVSRDALGRLEALAATASDDDLARVVDETLAAPGVALDGVRSLESVRAVISAARHGKRT